MIFDEASQLPVESVLPALFRAKRVIVSGDEKQMPPSRFFGSELESDEGEEEGEWNEEDAERLDDQERDRLAQAAGTRPRRHHAQPGDTQKPALRHRVQLPA